VCDRQYHPPNGPSKNPLAADLPTSAWDTRISVNAARDASTPTMCRRVRGPPAMIFASASAGDVPPPPSLVVSSLVTTNDIGSTAVAASVA